MVQYWDTTFDQFIIPVIYTDNEETYHLGVSTDPPYETINNLGESEINFFIFDINGNILFERSLAKNAIIDCTNFTSGYYITTLKTKGMKNFKTQKLLKQ